MVVKDFLDSGYRWEPDGEGKPMNIAYEREKLNQFWKLHEEDDFSTDEQLMAAYRVFEPEGVGSGE